MDPPPTNRNDVLPSRYAAAERASDRVSPDPDHGPNEEFASRFGSSSTQPGNTWIGTVNVSAIVEYPSANALKVCVYEPGVTLAAEIGTWNSPTCPGPTDLAPEDVTLRYTLAARVDEIHAGEANGLGAVVPRRIGPPTDQIVLPVLRRRTTRVAVSPATTDTGDGVASRAEFQYKTRNQLPSTPLDEKACIRSYPPSVTVLDVPTRFISVTRPPQSP